MGEEKKTGFQLKFIHCLIFLMILQVVILTLSVMIYLGYEELKLILTWILLIFTGFLLIFAYCFLYDKLDKS